MDFIIAKYKESVKVTYKNLENETVEDLKKHVSKYYGLKDEEYCLMDLGRILADEEFLKDLKRNIFTVYIKTYRFS